jgi:hypothetical protein
VHLAGSESSTTKTLTLHRRSRHRKCRSHHQNLDATSITSRLRTPVAPQSRNRSSRRQRLPHPRSQLPFWQNARFPLKKNALRTSHHTFRYGFTACVAVSSPRRSRDERFRRHSDKVCSLRPAGTTRRCPSQLVGLPIVQQLRLSPVLQHAARESARELSRRDCSRGSASPSSLHSVPFTSRARTNAPSNRSQAGGDIGRCATSSGAIEGRQSCHHQDRRVERTRNRR